MSKRPTLSLGDEPDEREPSDGELAPSYEETAGAEPAADPGAAPEIRKLLEAGPDAELGADEPAARTPNVRSWLRGLLRGVDNIVGGILGMPAAKDAELDDAVEAATPAAEHFLPRMGITAWLTLGAVAVLGLFVRRWFPGGAFKRSAPQPPAGQERPGKSDPGPETGDRPLFDKPLEG